MREMPTRQIRIDRMVRYASMFDGGCHNPVWTDALMDNPDDWWTIRRKPATQVQPFGRRPRPQPRTMPWAVALPILVWLILTGEMKWR